LQALLVESAVSGAVASYIVGLGADHVLNQFKQRKHRATVVEQVRFEGELPGVADPAQCVAELFDTPSWWTYLSNPSGEVPVEVATQLERHGYVDEAAQTRLTKTIGLAIVRAAGLHGNDRERAQLQASTENAGLIQALTTLVEAGQQAQASDAACVNRSVPLVLPFLHDLRTAAEEVYHC
jgi:hypothetical protein